jgi:hypothetical protein
MVTPTSPEGMGMGLLVTPGTHWRTVEHGGLNEGFKSRMVANLDKGYGAVVMTNGEQGAALANEILRAIAVTEGWEEFLPRVVTPLPLDAASLAEYAGTYSASPLGVVTCVVRDEHLVAVEAWGEETALVPVSDDTFVSRSGSPEYHFLRDAGGGVQAVELRSGSGTQRLFRSGDGASTALGPLMKGDVAGAADVLESTPGEGVAETGPLWAQIDDLAYRVLRGGFPERALLLFRFNARTYPENAVCQYGLADLYLKTGEIDRAREQFTRTLDVGREHPEVNARFAGLLRRAQEQLTMLRRGP